MIILAIVIIIIINFYYSFSGEGNSGLVVGQERVRWHRECPGILRPLLNVTPGISEAVIECHTRHF